MAALKLNTFGKVEAKDAIVLVAFPTTGSASSIAAQYLVRHLALPLVGEVPAPELAGVMAIQDGVATSAIRVYGGKVACRIGKKSCPGIFVVTTELTLPPPAIQRVAQAILQWASAAGTYAVLGLEAVIRMEGDTTPDVFCASRDAGMLKELVKAGIPAMQRAVIGGMNSFLVLAKTDVRTACLMVEATRLHPDGRAAAALIEAVSRFVPDVAIDHKPLMTEATKLEEEIRSTVSSAQQSVVAPDERSFI